MTTEIEKQFFETFGIEPEYKICPFHHCIYKKEYDCDNCDDREWMYPQITDHILLELICISNHEDVYIDLEGTDVETMKNNLLENFIFFKRIIPKHQVQALFKENN